MGEHQLMSRPSHDGQWIEGEKAPEDAEGTNGTPESTQASSTGSFKEDDAETFKLPTRSWLVFLTLAVLTLMVALDGTSISVALPVSFLALQIVS